MPSVLGCWGSRERFVGSWAGGPKAALPRGTGDHAGAPGRLQGHRAGPCGRGPRRNAGSPLSRANTAVARTALSLAEVPASLWPPFRPCGHVPAGGPRLRGQQDPLSPAGPPARGVSHNERARGTRQRRTHVVFVREGSQWREGRPSPCPTVCRGQVAGHSHAEGRGIVPGPDSLRARGPSSPGAPPSLGHGGPGAAVADAGHGRGGLTAGLSLCSGLSVL